MITCVIPTRNEAHNLPHALATLRWCDEIIVVDMESADGTQDVARASGARVVCVKQRPDFDMSRKIGLDAARNEWVLSLDADEMIPPRLAAALSDIVRNAECDVAVMPRLNFKFGIQRGGSLWPDYQRRLYRKGAVAFMPTVHQYLEIRSTRVEWLPAQDDLSLHHFNYTPVDKQIDKLNSYTSTAAMSAAPGVAIPWALTGLTRFLSLHLKHGASKEGIPGLWWSAQSAFYSCVERRKRIEIASGRTPEGTEKEIAQLNLETTELANARLERIEAPHYTISLAWLAWRLGVAALHANSFRSTGWTTVRGAFRDLVLEMKVWEMLVGRAIALSTQEDMRARVKAQWDHSAA